MSKCWKPKVGWEVSAYKQKQEHACGFSLSFVRHRWVPSEYAPDNNGDGSIGFFIMVEFLWLVTFSIGWNWY